MEPDAGAVFTTNIGGGGLADAEGRTDAMSTANGDPDRHELERQDLQALFVSFLTHFAVNGEYFYTTAMRRSLQAHVAFVEVDVTHLQQFSEHLAQSVLMNPMHTLPLFEEGCAKYAEQLHMFPETMHQRTLQVQLFWGVAPVKIRQLALEEVARLVPVSGIVVKVSATHPKCTSASIQCGSCHHKMFVPGGQATSLPVQCRENSGGNGQQKCRPNPYVLLTDECEFEDQQVLKLQELPEDVPTGELPRNVTVVVDKYLVDKVAPGGRVQVVAVIAVQERKAEQKGGSGGQQRVAGLRAQYLKAVGLMSLSGRNESTLMSSVNENYSSRVMSRASTLWQPEDEALFKAFAREGNVYETVSKNIDPAIFGLEDQKRSIACLLFGGTRKVLDGNNLRGDMNVLLIGDPSTAKSQLLKFTQRIAPIGIYTSGKGSSAAGLTASVAGSGRGEFWLEAGTMVLADGGVACIDEFDKMREQDQVAIHEAMEQQTISIAKANLTTMLNSRTSVLAAANPTLGAYDPLRSNEEQMDFQGSILTRFDLIFKVLDPRDPEIDTRLATHVVRLHQRFSALARPATTAGLGAASKTSLSSTQTQGNHRKESADYRDEHGNIKLDFLTKYIAFAKATCRPRISPEAVAALEDFYVRVRKTSHETALQAAKSSSGASAPAIQITPRQLESLVRITEAQAKMRLEEMANAADAAEAIRLFMKATVDAIASGVVDSNMTEQQSEAVLKIEDTIRRRVPVAATVRYAALKTELQRLDYDPRLVDRALAVMMRRGELEWRSQRTFIFRKS